MMILYPNQPSIDRAEQTASLINSLSYFGDVIHQPAEFQSTKISADWETAILFQKILVTTLDFGQKGFNSAFGASIEPN